MGTDVAMGLQQLTQTLPQAWGTGGEDALGWGDAAIRPRVGV